MLENLGIESIAALIIAVLILGIIIIKLKMENRIQELELRHQTEMIALRKKKQTGLKAQLKGDLAELVIPWLAESGCSGTELKHFGKPIDWIGFKGLDDPTAEIGIKVIEVKTGKTKVLSQNERRIKDAVERKDIEWMTIHINQKEVEEHLTKVGIQ